MSTTDTDTPLITPQQYEVLHGGGAEAAEIAKQRLSRRRFLRRSMLAVWGVATVASVAGALDMLYPALAQSNNQFGSALTVGKKADFPPAKLGNIKADTAGIFHKPTARTYVMHLSPGTAFLLSGASLQDQLQSENFVKDADGSYWLALYQRCVHLGCTVPYRDDCQSFKCPCHGSHYDTNGEYLDGPAPRSLDRFQMSFKGEDVVVDTGTINSTVQHPDASTRLFPIPSVQCSPSSNSGLT